MVPTVIDIQRFTSRLRAYLHDAPARQSVLVVDGCSVSKLRVFAGPAGRDYQNKEQGTGITSDLSATVTDDGCQVVVVNAP